MIRRWLILSLALGFVLHAGRMPAAEEERDEAIDFDEAIEDLDCRDGLITSCLDRDGGRVLLMLPAPDPQSGLVGRYIYQAYLRRGLGSNPLGLDRTVGGATQIVALRRVGGKLLIEAENWRFRADRGALAEQQAVAESFARSVLWAGELTAEADDGRLLVDLSSFLTRDALGIAVRIKRAEQGELELDAERSVVEVGDSLVFEDNLELEATLTFAGAEPGEELRQTAPDATAVSLVQHHSLVRLPPPGFEPRVHDPRSGTIEHVFYDYGTPLAEPLTNRWTRRHRLALRDPAAGDGAVERPIVYYVDPGAPEPVKTALIEGASWWREAFDAAGLGNAFRVEELPTGAHPLDVRYNVITWVHRATRGWSYGASVVDPRNGEIIKGYVLLGSQRVRQDRLIFEGLAGTAKTGTGAADDPVELALARIRQLSAHEVGHTLGLQHNFAASSYGRASVMDYPAPWVHPTPDGGLDFSEAYGVGVGPWDRFAIDWLYRIFPPDVDRRRALDRMAQDAVQAGLHFVTDQHGRGTGTAHPRGAIWDNGPDPVAALEEAMAVRRIALRNFGPDRVAEGQALSQLRRVLVPIYLYHRYQVDAAAKLLAGADFAYRVRGDDAQPVRWVAADRQRQALAALIATLDPAALDLPDAVLADLAPFSRGFHDDPVTDRELFPSAAGAVFDPLAAASAAAGITLNAIVHPARAARLVEQHRRNPDLPGLETVLESVEARLFDAPRRESDRLSEIRRVAQSSYVQQLIGLVTREESPSTVIFRVEAALDRLADRLSDADGNDTRAAHARWLASGIRRHLERDVEPSPAFRPAPEPPPGSPIGAMESCWHCEPLDRLQPRL